MPKLSHNNLSRRGLITSAAAATLVTAMPAPAAALTKARARSLVDKVVVDINKVIASGRSVNAMIADFERIFADYADVNIISRSALGADSRRASPAQLRAFSGAFRGYIARKYGKRFNEFVGGNVEVKSVRKVKSWHEVISTATLRGSAPFEVRFLVSDRSGKDLFFDMIIEGVSLRLSERTEIGALLDQRNGNIDRLISDLRNIG